MRRRELLAGLTGLTGALLLPIPKMSARPGPDPLAGSLQAILTGRTAAAPTSLPALRKHRAAAWHAFETCQYQALAGRLPSLVSAATASRDNAFGPARQAYSALVADSYVLASELALKANEDGIAWVAADRALSAARDSGDPAAIAAASRAVAMAMRRQGHYDGATTMLTSTALTLGADHGSPPPRVLAAYGSLLCTAAYACAQNGQRLQAFDLISEAQAAAARMGDARQDAVSSPRPTSRCTRSASILPWVIQSAPSATPALSISDPCPPLSATRASASIPPGPGSSTDGRTRHARHCSPPNGNPPRRSGARR